MFSSAYCQPFGCASLDSRQLLPFHYLPVVSFTRVQTSRVGLELHDRFCRKVDFWMTALTVSQTSLISWQQAIVISSLALSVVSWQENEYQYRISLILLCTSLACCFLCRALLFQIVRFFHTY